VEALYDSIREEVARYGTEIVVGNMSRTEGPIVVEIFLLGRLVLTKNNEAKERGERRPTQ
jgi:thiamine monophosphate kinase